MSSSVQYSYVVSGWLNLVKGLERTNQIIRTGRSWHFVRVYGVFPIKTHSTRWYACHVQGLGCGKLTSISCTPYLFTFFLTWSQVSLCLCCIRFGILILLVYGYMLPINHLLPSNIAWCQGIVGCRIAIRWRRRQSFNPHFFSDSHATRKIFIWQVIMESFLRTSHGHINILRACLWSDHSVSCWWKWDENGFMPNINPEDAPFISRYSFLQLDEYKSC